MLKRQINKYPVKFSRIGWRLYSLKSIASRSRKLWQPKIAVWPGPARATPRINVSAARDPKIQKFVDLNHHPQSKGFHSVRLEMLNSYVSIELYSVRGY